MRTFTDTTNRTWSLSINVSAIELRQKAIDEGMLTLRMSGLHKIRDGLTTIEESLLFLGPLPQP